MKKTLFLVLACLATAGPAFFPVGPAWADDSADMAAAAKAFYAIYSAQPRNGGIPDATGRVRYAPLLSPRLNKLLAQGAAAETRFQAKNKDSPPLIEGDLFSSLFEGANSARVGACGGDARTGHCTVSLTYNDPKKPVTWNDNVLLVNTPSGWKVDDIAYKAGFQFGNDGTLSDTLQMTIAQAQ